MTAPEMISAAFDTLILIQVRGNDVERMAQAKSLLKEAYKEVSRYGADSGQPNSESAGE